MNLGRATTVAVLMGIGLAIVCAARNPSSSPATDALTNQRQDDEANRLNLNQQYAGWTFGRLMGVSLNPDYVPPPPGF